MTTVIKRGKCACGCGRKTPFALHTNLKRGTVKGRPIRFIQGHEHRVHRPEGGKNFHEPTWYGGKQ